MLTISVGDQEAFDESTSRFVTIPGVSIDLEHSLVSLSKWESHYERPFLDGKEKTSEEVLFYIKCMILTPDVPPNILNQLSQENVVEISQYIERKASGTTFAETKAPPSREIITSELVYYWMIAFNIPIECETWHLNRLLTLIRVCNVKNQKPQKMNKAEVARRNRDLNAQRRSQLKTKG